MKESIISAARTTTFGLMGCCKSRSVAVTQDEEVKLREDRAYEGALVLLQRGFRPGRRTDNDWLEISPIPFSRGYANNPPPYVEDGLDVGDEVVYQGAFAGNLIEGSGWLQFPNNLGYFCGDVKQGVVEGSGVYVDAYGSVYVGSWDNNKANGNGAIVDGEKNMWYVGGFKDDTFNGFGIDMRYDSCYTGNTELGVMHGKGKIVEFGRKEVLVTNAEGVNETREVKEPRSYYEGTFNQGLKHGFGRCVFADSRVYVGHWVDDEMHGWGEFYFPNGEVFKGYYATNKKNGYGIHTWPNGRKYEGSFRSGFQHGVGIATAASGEAKIGQFENGFLQEWLPNESSKIVEKMRQSEEDAAVAEAKKSGIVLGPKCPEDQEKMELPDGPTTLEEFGDLMSVLEANDPDIAAWLAGDDDTEQQFEYVEVEVEQFVEGGEEVEVEQFVEGGEEVEEAIAVNKQ